MHSGQHWDPRLSDVFFDELDLPEPAAHLGAARLSPAPRLGRIVAGARSEIRAWRPDAVLVYGDTDTTLAAALAGRLERVPVVHVEAGMRSGEPRMPEEINRIATDHVSALLLAPTAGAAARLRGEHVSGRIETVGDVMLDALLERGVEAGGRSASRLGLAPGAYLVATVHRAANVDDAGRLDSLLRTLDELGEDVVLPMHPRTAEALASRGRDRSLARVRCVPPQPRGAMLELLRGARGVLTDSGGVQREAWFLGVPCATLRERTEWEETLADGWNRLVGADPDRIRSAVADFAAPRPERDLDVFGGGHAAERIVAALEADGAVRG